MRYDSATSVVSEAAAILREEAQSLAAGGAGTLSQVLGGDWRVDQPPVEQLRDQARSLVDTFVRVLGQRPGGLADLLPQTAGNTGNIGGRDGKNTKSVLVLQGAGPVRPGDLAHVSLRLMNDDSEAGECALFVTDLIGPSGQRIPATHVRVSPSRASVPPAGSVEVDIEVRVPSGVLDGCYSGLLQTDDGESLRALLHVTVSR